MKMLLKKFEDILIVCAILFIWVRLFWFLVKGLVLPDISILRNFMFKKTLLFMRIVDDVEMTNSFLERTNIPNSQEVSNLNWISLVCM